MAANASPRAQRNAVLVSPIGAFTDRHLLEIDCGEPACRRDRAYGLAGLTLHRDLTIGDFLKRARCQGCGGPVVSAALMHSVGLRRPVARRLWLMGAEARD